MQGNKTYEQFEANLLANIAKNEKIKKQAMKKFNENYRHYLEIKDMWLIHHLKRCVNSAFDVQLILTNPVPGGCGINHECSRYKHNGVSFTEYLRSNEFKKMIKQDVYVKEGFLKIIIPDELKNKLDEIVVNNRKVKENE